MRKPEFRSSEPMKSWSLQSIHNPSCSSTEEHTGTPGLTGQTLTINKTCGTWFIKKKHKKKNKKKTKGQTHPPSPSLHLELHQASGTFAYPPKWEIPAAPRMPRKSDASGKAPGTRNSSNPDSPTKIPTTQQAELEAAKIEGNSN